MRLERRIVDLPNGNKRYCVLGPKLAVDFHQDGELAGLETHYRERPGYMDERDPDFGEVLAHQGGVLVRRNIPLRHRVAVAAVRPGT